MTLNHSKCADNDNVNQSDNETNVLDKLNILNDLLIDTLDLKFDYNISSEEKEQRTEELVLEIKKYKNKIGTH